MTAASSKFVTNFKFTGDSMLLRIYDELKLNNTCSGENLKNKKKNTLQSEKNDDMRNLLRNNLKCIWLRSISHLSWEHNSRISIINLFSISNGDRERARARRASQHIKTYFFVLSE